MTGVSFLEEAMNKCVRAVIDGQQPDTGSYNYKYSKDSSEKQDLSVAGWHYQAMKAAYTAGCSESGFDGGNKPFDWVVEKTFKLLKYFSI